VNTDDLHNWLDVAAPVILTQLTRRRFLFWLAPTLEALGEARLSRREKTVVQELIDAGLIEVTARSDVAVNVRLTTRGRAYATENEMGSD